MTARCQRCGHAPGSGEFLATLAVTVNDICRVFRGLLCDPCRASAVDTIAKAVRPVGEAAA